MSTTRIEAQPLVIRLSSLGDLVLASSALSALPAGQQVDFLTGSEYVALLEGHPKIKNVIGFDRRRGVLDWVQFCWKLYSSEKYSGVYDLHSNLRSTIAQVVYSVFRFTGKKGPCFWVSFRKYRGRLAGLFVFKSLWPKAFDTGQMVERFSKLLGGSGAERPDLKFHIQNKPDFIQSLPEKYYCVMPSSLWPGKEWPVDFFIEVIQKTDSVPVVMGTLRDEPSVGLVSELERLKIPHINGVGKWNLKQAAQVLGFSEFYVGSDTGLAHVAEAVGIAIVMLLGPATQRVGFSPWRKESQIAESPLWCRPCGKDGRFCIRPVRRYLCLKEITPENVLSHIQKLRQQLRVK